MGLLPDSLRDYQDASRSRAERWHDGSVDNWSLSQWSNALAGEVGELCGAVKEYDRKSTGAADKGMSWSEIQESIAEEIADVISYALLVAERADIDALRAFEGKFNAVSAKRGFPEKVGSNSYYTTHTSGIRRPWCDECGSKTEWDKETRENICSAGCYDNTSIAIKMAMDLLKADDKARYDGWR